MTGATLLYDSVPEDEEREDAHSRPRPSSTRFAVRRAAAASRAYHGSPSQGTDQGRGNARVLLVDHQDSFVHTLANYLATDVARTVVTLRAGFPHSAFEEQKPDLVVLVAGSGFSQRLRRLRDDRCGPRATRRSRSSASLSGRLARNGRTLRRQGSACSTIPCTARRRRSDVVGAEALFAGLPKTFRAGRYHSLFAIRDLLPKVLRRHCRKRRRRHHGRRASRRLPLAASAVSSGIVAHVGRQSRSGELLNNVVHLRSFCKRAR